MFCYNCGAKLLDGAKFCSSCGQQLANAAVSSESSSFQVQAKSQKLNTSYDSADINKKMKDENFRKIISTHAFGSATAALASGWIPGAGSTIAVATGLGFIISMYARMSSYLGIGFSKNKLKVFGTSTVSLLSLMAMNIAAGTALSLIPGVGSVASAVLAAATQYATVSVSALVYQRVISGLVMTGKDISTLSDEELKNTIKNSMGKDELKSAFKEAQAEFKVKKASGEFDKAEKAEMMDEFKDVKMDE